MGIRLCKLRCQKVEDQWQSIYAYAAAQCLADDEDTFSLFANDVRELCEHIGAIIRSVHTFTVWSCGLAVFEVLMDDFGNLEGARAVVDHMEIVGIAATKERCLVLQLALI